MRLVVDPGVYVAATISSRGAPAELVRLWRLREVDFLVSPILLDELERVLNREALRPFVSAGDASGLVAELRRRAQVVDDATEVPRISRDPNDDYLLALAVSFDVDALVSGDRDLTEIDAPPIPVLTPREVVELVRGSGS